MNFCRVVAKTVDLLRNNMNMYTFSDDFLKLNKSSKISEIFYNFVLFYRILNYWHSVNKMVVDDYFELLDVEKHLCKHF